MNAFKYSLNASIQELKVNFKIDIPLFTLCVSNQRSAICVHYVVKIVHADNKSW